MGGEIGVDEPPTPPSSIHAVIAPEKISKALMQCFLHNPCGAQHYPLTPLNPHPDMNHRLLTPAEKKKNKLGRLHRNKLARRRKRRASVPNAVPDFLQTIMLAAGTLSPEEGQEFHHSHLGRVRTLVKKLERRSFYASFDPVELPPAPEGTLKVVGRPTRRLQKSRRGLLPGRFSAPAPPALARPYSHDETFKALRALAQRSYCRLRMLELMKNVTRIELKFCATILGTITGVPYKKREIAAFERIGMFHSFYYAGQENYAVLVMEDGLERAEGDWALLEHDDLLNLLPGLRIPDRLVRREYLLRLHTGEFGNLTCLDIHSLSYAPLVRCELGG